MSTLRAELSDIAAWCEVDRVLVVCVAPERWDHEPRGAPVVVCASPDPGDQHTAPFGLVHLADCLDDASPEVLRAALHQAVQHLAVGGTLSMTVGSAERYEHRCFELGMVRDVGARIDALVCFRRSERTTIHDLLWEARSMIGRVRARDLAAEMAGPRPPLVVDTRTHTDRGRLGVIEGSVHVPRTVLEWHLDPANGYHHPAVEGLDQPIVVVCNGGYSSSLAAANLVRLGFSDVRDLIGGVRAWAAEGLPTTPPDHSHLDM